MSVNGKIKKLPLTNLEKDVFGFILGYISDYEYSPTLEEVGLKFNQTKGWAQQIVNNLCLKGKLYKDDIGTARNIRILIK